MFSIDVIATACRKRRNSHSPYHQSNHYKRWLASLGVEVEDETESIPDWDPPEYHFFYKILGPKTVPKINSKISFTLVPAMLNIRHGRVYVTNENGYIKLVARPNLVKEIYCLDGDKWYSIVATVVSRPKQELGLPEPYLKRMQYVPGTNDRFRFIYNPKEQFGAIQSYSDSEGGYKPTKDFTAPYYHFDNCLECQDEIHQIGYIVANGPHFTAIDYLSEHPEEATGQILNYYIDKVVCAKTANQLTKVTRQSFLLKVEVLSVNAEKELLPDYRMIVGRVCKCSPLKLYPNESAFIAKNSDESDSNLFKPGTYLYIDHYVNQQHQPETKNANPYSDDSEYGQICYIIGPETPKFGAFPIRPFS